MIERLQSNFRWHSENSRPEFAIIQVMKTTMLLSERFINLSMSSLNTSLCLLMSKTVTVSSVRVKTASMRDRNDYSHTAKTFEDIHRLNFYNFQKKTNTIIKRITFITQKI